MKGSPDQDRLLAEFVTGMSIDQLSARDREVARAGILDCLGVMISGSQGRHAKGGQAMSESHCCLWPCSLPQAADLLQAGPFF